MSAEELPGQANVDGAPPFLRHNVLDAPRRTDNAGFVDERVEAAERRLGVDKEMSDVGTSEATSAFVTRASQWAAR